MNLNFKQNLKNELLFQNLTVKELAFKTNVSQRTLEGYLGNRSSIPPADVAVKIAEALNVSVEFLVNGKDKIQPVSFESDEKRLLNIFRKLSERDKRILIGLSLSFLNEP